MSLYQDSERHHPRPRAEVEAEHPYDVKRREDARIMREHRARCADPECCATLTKGKGT